MCGVKLQDRVLSKDLRERLGFDAPHPRQITTPTFRFFTGQMRPVILECN